MQLNSLTYIAFFLLPYLAYRTAPHRFQNRLLLIASYIFYAWWDVRFLFLILLSTVMNYGCGIVLREGVISARQRFFFSVWIIIAYFLTIVIQWQHFAPFQSTSASSTNWHALVSGQPDTWLFFVAFGIGVSLFNLVYPRIASLSEERKRGLLVLLGVSVNLVLLGFFKHYNFFIENIEWLLSGLNMNPPRLHLNIILPIGISFYTFKGISYVVDSYRGKVKIPHSFSDFSLFMAFFPSILAGPIDRASSFLQQICERRNLSWEQSIRGIHLFLYGLFKKVVIADGVVRSVASVFDSTGQASWIDVVLATLLFTIQIYCDFSGYTDMARGSAKLLGIDLMVNFRLPYFSKNPQEFWSRWHISLSTWLRDYLYIPLGGNRTGQAKTYRNLIITMILGGLWHGAAWNFVLWGLYHGIALSIHRAILSIRTAALQRKGLFYDIAKITVCLMIVCYGWLLFRAPSLEKILTLTSTLIFDFGNLDLGIAWPRLAAAIGIPILFIAELAEKASEEKPFYQKMPVSAWTSLYAAIIFCLAMGITTESTQFIYMVF